MTEDQFARFVDYVEGRFQHLEARMATKADLTQEIGSLRLEMRERFEIVHERLAALEKGQGNVQAGLDKVRAEVRDLGARMDRIEVQVRDTNSKLIDLREEMQQRFRSVSERLRAVEERIAA